MLLSCRLFCAGKKKNEINVSQIESPQLILQGDPIQDSSSPEPTTA